MGIALQKIFNELELFLSTNKEVKFWNFFKKKYLLKNLIFYNDLKRIPAWQQVILCTNSEKISTYNLKSYDR